MGTKDFSEKFKDLKINDNKDINILLLGETGVGKSTFINSIANYLHFKKFKKAEKHDLRILIPTTITFTDNKTFESVKIELGRADNNEYQEVGASATQDVKTYVFPIGEGKTRLRLIDSPGMGDTRGVEQDNKNCDNILSYLSQIKELHAICFLMKPTNTRITVLFEYCVKEILSRLEKSASKNIIFIFTNTRGTDYSGGETLPCLKRVIDKIKANPPHVDIPLRENIFCLDNEAFRILAAIKNGAEYDDAIKKKFVESWDKSSEECWRLICYIVGDGSREPLPPHQMHNTTCVNEARRLITQLSHPLADISQLIYDNIRILDRHKQQLQIANQSLDEMKKKMYIPVIDLQVTKLTQPVTVCSSLRCADVIKVGEVKKWHYKTRCHDPCYLTNITNEMIGDPGLVNCAAMNGTKTCFKCNCDFSVHMHVYYMTKPVDDKIIDNVMQDSIKTKETAILETRRIMNEIDKRKQELDNEREVIIKTTAQFAHFLQHNAITPFNDSYEAYIKYLITREKSLGQRCDLGILDNLEQLLLKYKETKDAFDKSLTLGVQFGGSVVTAKTVMDSVAKLYNLRHNGKKIHELFKTQKSSRNAEYDKMCEYIDPVKTGFKPDFKQKSSDTKTKSKEGKTDKYKSDNETKKNKCSKSNKSDTEGQKGQTFNKGPQNFKQRSYQNFDNRPREPRGPYVQQYQGPPPPLPSWSANHPSQELPPPYPGYDYQSSTSISKQNSGPEFSISHDGDAMFSLKIKHPKGSENKNEHSAQDRYQHGPYSPYGAYGPPPQEHFYNQPPMHDPYAQNPQGYYYQRPPPPGNYSYRHAPPKSQNNAPYQGAPFYPQHNQSYGGPGAARQYSRTYERHDSGSYRGSGNHQFNRGRGSGYNRSRGRSKSASSYKDNKEKKSGKSSDSDSSSD